jgi:hypothetical protein
MGTAAAKERGKHQGEDFAQEFSLTAQAAFDLEDQLIGQTQVVEGLMEGVDIALCFELLAFVAFFGVETAAMFGFGLFSGVSFGKEHGVFLRIVWERYWFEGNHAPCGRQ